MVESSDLQGAIQRTQATERLQQLQNQQEEANRKRFELELARQRAEKMKKVQDMQKAEHKRVDRDRYDGNEDPRDSRDEPRRGKPEEEGDEPSSPGGLDVRV